MNRTKSRLRSSVRAGKRRWYLIREFYLDFRGYLGSCAPADEAVHEKLRGTNLEAQLTKDYHRVEKGLSLRAPKRPFGSLVDARLSLLIPAAANAARTDFVNYAEDARTALADWNSSGIVSELVSPAHVSSGSALTYGELEAFFASRRSVRDFDERRLVDRQTVEAAVRLGAHTPSVCNRQAARVHAFYGADQAQRILRHQNGNSGFRPQVQTVLIVTVERGLFAGAGERNQRWIDGGLFAMTLVWALHGLGVSSCMLNWSMTNAKTDALRQAAAVPASEDVICMIAVGYQPKEGVRVARSERRPVDQILTNHD
jgi:nitroreductase